ncbi:MAG: helicase [Chloroflexi bacterium]|nr:helicase [Chloroflexota bacterium]
MTQEKKAGAGPSLSDFQRTTAEYAFRRLYGDSDSTRRFLVADETGLGKTHVAREVIAQTIEHLQHADHVNRIDIVYVCSNADIAAQNIRKLNITGSESPSFATRLSLLITMPEMLRAAVDGGSKPTTFVAFTPGTSFQLGHQMGRKEERAVLYVLLSDHLGLRGARATAALRIFQGGVSTWQKFRDWNVGAVDADNLEPEIRQTFLKEFDQSQERASLVSLIDEVAGRSALRDSQQHAARIIVGELRRMLSRSALQALEPDLVILDEFQRFRDLLDVKTGGDAAELADDLFNHPDAHVLLLSATPYKPFTYAEEAGPDGGHYADFLKTLDFLAASDAAVDSVRADLDELRQAALAGEPTVDVRDRVQSQLRKWIARTERPSGTNRAITVHGNTDQLRVRAEDFNGFVALRNVADAVRAPLTVEYWKSSPYFLNFLRGYRVGEHLREDMKDPDRRAELMPLFRGAQRIDKYRVENFQEIEWGNARMRALAAETLDQGWWKLLWMPPSLPYHALAGPYASIDPTTITKSLIFSSWVAAPSAIASLLSYEVERQIFTQAGHTVNTAADRRSISSRLDYRMTNNRPSSMSALALFWPQPTLASRTDPLDAAREQRDDPDLPGVDRLIEWAKERVGNLVGPNGENRSPTSAPWYWFASVRGERNSALASALPAPPRSTVVDALAGVSEDHDAGDGHHGALDAHVGQMLSALGDWAPDTERPADLHETISVLGLGAPGNIAWRALNRLRRADDQATEIGRWRAAAILASGLRSLFVRPEAVLLLDDIYGGSGGDAEDIGAYWRKVARYCIDGGLQAVLDEYIHHLAGDSGSNPTTDEGLVSLALTARRAITLRESVYRATDIDHFDDRGIAFPSRYALRFGSTQRSHEEARLPEVRAAFNSPFWPFVLATTSIGQEGVDFHWWCHSIVHWNLPGNPVDFEQREGRVDRYKGHAIRKNVAAAHRSEALATGITDPWGAVFDAAVRKDDTNSDGLSPFWIYPGDARIQRRIMTLPLSRDQDRWDQLQESLALYRLAFGQPRQEDMLAALQRRGIASQPDQVADLRIDLRPPAPTGA